MENAKKCLRLAKSTGKELFQVLGPQAEFWSRAKETNGISFREKKILYSKNQLKMFLHSLDSFMS